MAKISDARATYGLQAAGIHTSSGVSGSVQIGTQQTQVRFPTADVAYSIRAIFAGTADNLVIDLTDCDTTGSTAFVAGTAQVETATITAASGATTGTMTMVLTAAGMTGSPLNVPVALVTGTHTTAALIASAARAALSANAVVDARFSIGGTGANIVLTHKPTSTHSVPTGTLNLYAANDTTLNLAIPAGLGVTLAATSANTTAGVVSDGVKIYDGDGKDFEGDALATISAFYGLLATGTGSISYASSASVYKGGVGNGSMFLQSIGDMPLTFTSNHSEAAELTITVIGASA
jgi:hypothetical protein